MRRFAAAALIIVVACLLLPCAASAQTASTSIDLSPIMTPILQVLGAVLAVVLPALAGWALTIFQKRTGITLTDQQRASVLGAVGTSSGILMTKLANGVKPLETIQVSDPEVVAEANRILASVPEAVASLGVTQETVANMIVGKVGEAIAADPTIPTVPVTTSTAAATVSDDGKRSTAASTSTTATDASGAAAVPAVV